MASIVMALPFALGFDASALVVAVVIGVLMMGTGLAAATQISGRGGPGALRVSAHVDVDLGLALASALAALVFAIGGDVGSGRALRGRCRSPGAAGGDHALQRAGLAT